MEIFFSYLVYIKEIHLFSILFGMASAFLWLISAFVKAKDMPLTFGVIFPEGTVSMHQYLKTVRLQSKYNSGAAVAAALSMISQVLGI